LPPPSKGIVRCKRGIKTWKGFCNRRREFVGRKIGEEEKPSSLSNYQAGWSRTVAVGRSDLTDEGPEEPSAPRATVVSLLLLTVVKAGVAG